MLKKTQRVVNCRISTKLFLPTRSLPRSLPHLLIAGEFSGRCRQRNILTDKRTMGFPEMPMFVMFVPVWKPGVKDIRLKEVYLTAHLNCTFQPSHLLPAGLPFGAAKAKRRWRLSRVMSIQQVVNEADSLLTESLFRDPQGYVPWATVLA